MSKGFTLIEVLIASLIMSIFAVSFAYFGQAAIQQAKASQDITLSALISTSVMENLRAVPFDALFSYDGRTFDGGKGTIHVTAKGSDLVSIKVSHKVELYTIRSGY